MKTKILSNLNLPSPSDRRIAIRVSSRAARAIQRGHPWLYESAIRKQSHEGSSGDIAIIFDSNRRFLAAGLFDPQTSIRVRILQHTVQASIDQDWFNERIRAAVKLRVPLLSMPPERATTGYRLVHGENDGLPGLIVDRYEEILVLKLYTCAWIPHLKNIFVALEKSTPGKYLILRLGRAMMNHPQSLYGLQDGMVFCEDALSTPIIFQENGLFFEVDPILGQKTGFFLDQRDNRFRVENLAKGKSVLNAFSYTGGFSVYAARGGAKHIISLDQSGPALEAAIRNFAHNQDNPAIAKAKHETMIDDAFVALMRMKNQGRLFDMVIADPPMFAHKQAQIAKAMHAYRRLTHLSLGVLRSGGILVQASCSSQIRANEFFKGVHQAATQNGRNLSEIERSEHGIDHPITFNEGAYLKCMFAVVR
ncbi:MAG: class I SAM-dependent methyltransferase [Chloroflexi bacterium]|nr:class I SAM-dependent methyltransferase [Chloroflexota bacterium]